MLSDGAMSHSFVINDGLDQCRDALGMLCNQFTDGDLDDCQTCVESNIRSLVEAGCGSNEGIEVMAGYCVQTPTAAVQTPTAAPTDVSLTPSCVEFFMERCAHQLVGVVVLAYTPAEPEQ